MVTLPGVRSITVSWPGCAPIPSELLPEQCRPRKQEDRKWACPIPIGHRVQESCGIFLAARRLNLLSFL
jgi:hypothetical protein